MSTPTPSRSWTIGSAYDCDLVADQPKVSAKHCRLSLYGDRYVLEDTGSRNGTFVNGHRLEVNKPVYVSRQDEITLSREVPMPWPDAPRQAAAKAVPRAQTITIGRNPDSDVQLDYGMISWDHAHITLEPAGGWSIEDHSLNGTALNRVDNRITRAPLQPTDDIYLGSYKITASKILTRKHFTQGETPFERLTFRGDKMTVGRDPTCDCPLDFPMISWHHARIDRVEGQLFVEDLGSRNGTYVNGVRISGRTRIGPGQEIGLGSFLFQILDDGGIAKREYFGNVTIEVAGVSVNTPNGKQLLDPISLTIFPSELVALMGPAGAGKTTFLKALNGYTTPANGRVLFNGADLYRLYDRFRLQMSYVPQDDIVHAQLKVWEALYYSAKLRTDLKDEEIYARIDKTLKDLKIEDKKDDIIGSPERKVLSGGQRKRVNIAMELINDTPVIFLDEPTSGLSSYDAESVIALLKELSGKGKTIITTIHQPSLDVFRQFDNLIMIGRDRGGIGRLAFFGPAYPNSIEFFHPQGAKEMQAKGKDLSPEMLLSGLATRKTVDWSADYERSPIKKAFVDDRVGKLPNKVPDGSTSAVRGFGFGQWWTLVRRNIIVKSRDRMQTLLLLIQAPAFGLLVSLVFRRFQLMNPNDVQKWGEMTGKMSGLEFLVVIAAIWFGCNNAARDIVGEWTVFQRERMVSLKLPSYVFSKFAVATALSIFQCLTLVGIVYLICGLHAESFLACWAITLSASLVGVGLGLCVSALASTTEVAIAMLPLILLPMIALGGGLIPVAKLGPIKPIAAVIPSRWAFEANLLLEAQYKHNCKIPARPADGSSKPSVCEPTDESDDKAAEEIFGSTAGKHDIAAKAFPGDDENPRTPLGRSFAVLWSMIAVLISAVIGILRKRDIR
jgi:ABC-type multidrug transport system ATPase subunit/pSer/pThr/pTyr-binding forkhead associated (FHA) protein/ABC-type multidrug transport system permease subunit